MSYLKSIKRLSAAGNLGSIVTIQVSRKSSIVKIPDPVDGVIYGDITFLAGQGFFSWEVSMDSAGASSVSRKSKEGSSKGNRIDFIVPKDRADLRSMFEQAEKDELVLLFKDSNGVQKIFGLLHAPAQFKFDHETGDQVSGLNHYKCSFYYDGPDNMFEYNGAIPSAPAGPAPSIVRYNGNAIASLQPGEELNIISDFGFEQFYITGP
jgi:hypothetical protein